MWTEFSFDKQTSQDISLTEIVIIRGEEKVGQKVSAQHNTRKQQPLTLSLVITVPALAPVMIKLPRFATH